MFNSLTRFLNLPPAYYKAIKVGNPIFPVLFEFENGLRIAVNKILSELYGEDWWETSLKHKIKGIYDYVEDQKLKKDKMKWIGDSKRTVLFPLHSVTLGQLEDIIKIYKSELIPELFPTIDFFSGHLEIIKRVRNMYSHMYPCIDKEDIIYAKSEIKTLCRQIKSKT